MNARLTLAAALAALCLAGAARAQSCPDGTDYEELGREYVGRQLYIHYRCVDQACVDALDDKASELTGQCEDLHDRLENLDAVEAKARGDLEREIHRAQEDLKDDFHELLGALEQALLIGSFEAAAHQSLSNDLVTLGWFVQHGQDLRRLGLVAGRLSTLVAVVEGAELSLEASIAWRTLLRVVSLERDADYLAELLAGKRVELQGRLSACNARLAEAQSQREGCFQTY
jgi:hypothetical protein